MPNMEPLDHYISRPQPDAAEEVHAELDNLARVAIAAGEALTRATSQRGARDAKALAAAAAADMGAAADDLAQTYTAAAAGATPIAEPGHLPASSLNEETTTPPTIGELLDMSEPNTGAVAPANDTGTVAGPAAEPTIEVPITLRELLDASHPLSASEELAAAQLSAGSAPTATAPPVEASLATEVGLG